MMFKQIFHILFEAILKILILGVLLFSMAYLVFVATADARPTLHQKHFRHIPKGRKKSKIVSNMVMGGVVTHMAFKAVKAKNYNQFE